MKSMGIIGAVLDAIARIVIVIAAIYAIYKGALFCYDYGYRIFTEPAISVTGEGRVVTVAVTENMSPSDIGRLFESKGLVRDGRLFSLQYRLSEYVKDVKPGVYDLSTSMTAEDMMEVMARNQEEVEEGSESGMDTSAEAGVPAGGAQAEEEFGDVAGEEGTVED